MYIRGDGESRSFMRGLALVVALVAVTVTVSLENHPLADRLKLQMMAGHQQASLTPPCTFYGNLCAAVNLRPSVFENMNDPAVCLATNQIGNYGGFVKCRPSNTLANWVIEVLQDGGNVKTVRIWSVRDTATKDGNLGYRFLLSARESNKVAPWSTLSDPGCQTWIMRRLPGAWAVYTFTLQNCRQYPGNMLSVRNNPNTGHYFEIKPPNTSGFVQTWSIYEVDWAVQPPRLA